MYFSQSLKHPHYKKTPKPKTQAKTKNPPTHPNNQKKAGRDYISKNAIMGNIFTSAQLGCQKPSDSSPAFEGVMFCISLSSRYSTDGSCSCTVQMKACVIYFFPPNNSCNPKFTQNYVFPPKPQSFLMHCCANIFTGNARDSEAILTLVTILGDMGKLLPLHLCSSL